MPAGEVWNINCADSNAETGDEIVATWSNGRGILSPVLMNSIVQSGSIFFGFENPRSGATVAQPPVDLSYIIFKK
jgi:hypothetical protein